MHRRDLTIGSFRRTPGGLEKSQAEVEAALAPISASSDLAQQVRTKCDEFIRNRTPIPWQVPVLAQLAAQAKTESDRAGFLRRALSKMAGPR